MMNVIYKRNLLFLFGCIGSRLTITYISYVLSNHPDLAKIGYVAMLPAIGFIIIYLFGLRKTGVEVSGGVIWWNNLRPLHGVLLGIFSYMAINKNKESWRILFADTLLGLSAFTIQRLSM